MAVILHAGVGERRPALPSHCHTETESDAAPLTLTLTQLVPPASAAHESTSWAAFTSACLARHVNVHKSLSCLKIFSH